MKKSLSRAPAASPPLRDGERIESLMAALDDGNGVRRQKACFGLIAIGEPAVLLLAEALTSPRRQVRWEAAKAKILAQRPFLEVLLDEDAPRKLG